MFLTLTWWFGKEG